MKTDHSGRSIAREKLLLAAHMQHEGLYARIAVSLGVDASYVSRVARNERQSPRIKRALSKELERMQHNVRRQTTPAT